MAEFDAVSIPSYHRLYPCNPSPVLLRERCMDMSMEIAMVKSKQRSIQKFMESSMESSIERYRERIREQTTQRPMERSTQRSLQSSTERSIQTPMESPSPSSMEWSSQSSLERSIQWPMGTALHSSMEKSLQRSIQQSMESSMQRSIERLRERIRERATLRSMQTGIAPRGLLKNEINRLPTRKFIIPGNVSTSQTGDEVIHKRADLNKECQVCLCDYENEDILRILPCFHEFHTPCIGPWLKITNTCPVCRVKVVFNS